MWISVAGAGVFFFLMLVSVEIGYRLGTARRARLGPAAREGVGAVEGSVFALLGLIIAFTFSGASSRFDARRVLIAEEANAISTAWNRMQLLPEADRAELRPLFQHYVSARMESAPGQSPVTNEIVQETDRQLERIREVATSAALGSSPPVPLQLVVPPLDAMSDVATYRRVAKMTHPPDVVYHSLGLTALLAAMLAGLAQGSSNARSVLHSLAFCGVIAMTAYMILDIEYPRAGLIRLDKTDKVLEEVSQLLLRQ